MGRKKKASARECPSPSTNGIEHPGREASSPDQDSEIAQPPESQPSQNCDTDEALKPTGDDGEHQQKPTEDTGKHEPAEAEEALPLPSPTLPLPPRRGRNQTIEGRGEQRGPGREIEHPAREVEQPLAPTSKAPIRAAEGSACHETVPEGDSMEGEVEEGKQRQQQKQQEEDEQKPNVIRGHLTEIEEAPISPSDSAADSRMQQEEDEKQQQQHQQQWMQQKKHFIVLTSAGKPVYSRHGDEDALAGLMALTTAMVSVVQDQGDTIQHVTAGTTTIVFLIKGPLYFVVSSQLGEPVMVLQRQLEMLHLQIMLVVSSGLERILSRNPSYDARGMLEGMGVVLDKLIDNMQEDATHLLLGLQPLGNLAPPVRSSAMRALSEAVKASGAVYGLLLAAGGQAVAVERGKGSPSLDHRDVLLLDNFICCNPAFRQEHAEAFCPLCLPSYDPTAFLHAYVHFFIPLKEEEWQSQEHVLHLFDQGQGEKGGQGQGDTGGKSQGEKGACGPGQEVGQQGPGHAQNLQSQNRQGHAQNPQSPSRQEHEMQGQNQEELEMEAQGSQHEGQHSPTAPDLIQGEGSAGQPSSCGSGSSKQPGQSHTRTGQELQDQGVSSFRGGEREEHAQGLGSSHAGIEAGSARCQQDEQDPTLGCSGKEQGHSHLVGDPEGWPHSNQHGREAQSRSHQLSQGSHAAAVGHTAPGGSTKGTPGASDASKMRHRVYLVLLSSSPTAFHELSAARAKMEEELTQSRALPKIRTVAAGFQEGRLSMSSLPKPLGGPSIAASPLYHFMARLPHRRQAFRAALLGHPLFSTRAAKASLSRCYAQMYAMMTEPAEITGRPSKGLWLATENNIVLALADSEIELYMVLDPLIDKAGAVRIGEQLRHYLLDLSTRAKNLLSSC